MEETLFFAVFQEGGEQPVAMFSSFEDAFDWACERFAAGMFRLKRWPSVPVSELEIEPDPTRWC